MSEQTKRSNGERHRKWWRSGVVTVGVTLTAILLGAGLAPLFFIGVASNSWLQNVGNLGQFISGLFAPVAFIWVVVAVILQGRELELQRQELQETREVMALQKEEMKRAADENSQQTKIMTENLKREAARIEYDSADNLLYSTALLIFTNRRNFLIKLTPQGEHLYAVPPAQDPIDKTNSDLVFATSFASVVGTAHRIRENPTQNVVFGSTEARFAFLETRKRLDALRQHRNSNNELIKARLSGLNFDTFEESFVLICDRIEPRV